MKIQTIPEDYIINPTQECLGVLQSDFVLKAAKFVNDSADPILIEEICFSVYARGKLIKEILYRDDALRSLISKNVQEIRDTDVWFSQVKIGHDRFFSKAGITGEPVLQGGQEVGFMNEFFIVVNKQPIDNLKISVRYQSDGASRCEEIHLPVIDYRSKNEYIFPVKGTWQINGNYDCIGAHRTQYSMEFAIDLGCIEGKHFVYHEIGDENENYVSYGKEILAIADGEVVDCFRNSTVRLRFPENTMDEKDIEEKERIVKAYGFLPIQCGNYVIIRHEHGEYSLYGHMIPGSQTIAKGDRVKQGQVIGQIGNTGMSGSPHLHFHVMDGPSFLTSRGLPCYFTNIRNIMNDALDLIREEYTLVVTQ